jgi:uncharacterized protein with PIN domain
VDVEHRSLVRVYVRFYAELNDHLPEDQRFQTIEKSCFVPGTVKDLIESLGVPHTEVELITVNGNSVYFSRVVQDGDYVSVYPMFESIDITPEVRVREGPLRETKFVLDVDLGRLAAYLRMLGFDTVYQGCFSDVDLVRMSSTAHRILLTRDRGLLKHGALTHGYWVRETDSRRQVAEIVERFDLSSSIRPFTRCMKCNGLLREVSKLEVQDRIPPRATELYEEFRRCDRCGRVYWKGSHYQRMERWNAELTARRMAHV